MNFDFSEAEQERQRNAAVEERFKEVSTTLDDETADAAESAVAGKSIQDRLQSGILVVPEGSDSEDRDPPDWDDEGAEAAELDNPFIVPSGDPKFILTPVADRIRKYDSAKKDDSALEVVKPLSNEEEEEILAAVANKTDMLKKALWEVMSLRLACEAAEGDVGDEMRSMLEKSLPSREVDNIIGKSIPLGSIMERAVFVKLVHAASEMADMPDGSFIELMLQSRLGAKNAETDGRRHSGERGVYIQRTVPAAQGNDGPDRKAGIGVSSARGGIGRTSGRNGGRTA